MYICEVLFLSAYGDCGICVLMATLEIQTIADYVFQIIKYSVSLQDNAFANTHPLCYLPDLRTTVQPWIVNQTLEHLFRQQPVAPPLPLSPLPPLECSNHRSLSTVAQTGMLYRYFSYNDGQAKIQDVITFCLSQMNLLFLILQ